MQVIENLKVREKIYIEKLKNGLTIMIIPKEGMQKKYMIWGTKYGSNESSFIVPGEEEITNVPNGVAHFLEHKLFEQENGTNSLDVLTALGVEANAYTTNDHTAYLFESTDNFYEAMDELMDYVQHPYFTDENVEKERGIIGQEIGRYDDEPAWKLYTNTLECLYANNPVRLDIAGTVESISKITKETLYSCYNTFYHPSNMIMCISGNFVPEEIVEEVKKRLIPREKMSEIKRIYPEKETKINMKKKEQKMDVNIPMFAIGYRDYLEEEDKILKQLATGIIINSIVGKTSKNYKEMYDKGLLLSALDYDFENTDEYSHILLSSVSEKPEDVYEIVTRVLEQELVEEEDFERSKKALYGEYVSEYNDVEEIGRMYLQDAMKGINSLDYINAFENITLEYVHEIQKDIFKRENSVLSIIRK